MKKFLIAVLFLLLAVACAFAGQTKSGTAETSARPKAEKTSAAKETGSPDIRVWVNTQSRLYFCPGSANYGKTKQGEYMTQKAAQEKHYSPAFNKVCK